MEKNIFILSGSLSGSSINSKVAGMLVSCLQNMAGDYQINNRSISEFNIELYNSDIEQRYGVPDEVQQLKSEIAEADGLIVLSPEYNGSIPGGFKNVLDWLSRPAHSEEKSCAIFQYKKTAIVSCSRGSLGGIRVIYHLRDIMMNMGSLVMPEFLSLPYADNIDEDKQQKIKDFALRFCDFVN